MREKGKIPKKTNLTASPTYECFYGVLSSFCQPVMS